MVDVEVRGEVFTTKGLAIREYNYLDVYLYEKWSDAEIPNFQEG